MYLGILAKSESIQTQPRFNGLRYVSFNVKYGEIKIYLWNSLGILYCKHNPLVGQIKDIYLWDELTITTTTSHRSLPVVMCREILVIIYFI